MSKEVVSKQMFEIMVKHLVNIEEEKEQVLGKYYPDITEKRDAYEAVITEYIKKIEGYISNYKVDDAIKSACPCVIIGSIVELEDLQYNEIEKYQIVSPFESKMAFKTETASYLSPMGKALLLKRPNEQVNVETPMGKFAYIIKSIEVPQEALI
ncbi:MAG: GreA/GreB family elongation factor [Clostridia bacterium]